MVTREGDHLHLTATEHRLLRNLAKGIDPSKDLANDTLDARSLKLWGLLDDEGRATEPGRTWLSDHGG